MNAGFWVSVACVAILSGVDYTSAFSYEGEEGPEFWPEIYPTCGGKRQSPINIVVHQVKKADLPPLEFSGYDLTPTNTKLTNNGHTAMLELMTTAAMSVKGGPLKSSEYIFAQLHFHWGPDDGVGSENMLNGKAYPLEMHIVSYKRDYGSMNNATSYEDGVAVQAYFFEVDETANPAYEEIVSAMPLVTKPETHTDIQKQNTINSLLSKNQLNYYTYHGSLTTPTCLEVVTWIVFEEPILVSRAQIAAFRKIKSATGDLTRNYRPTQEVNERTLWHQKGGGKAQPGETPDKSAAMLNNPSVLITLVLAGIVSRIY